MPHHSTRGRTLSPRVMTMTTSDDSAVVPSGRERTITDEDLQQIRESLRGLRFGSVNIIVQDGLIVQIDRTEKRRVINGQRQQR